MQPSQDTLKEHIHKGVDWKGLSFSIKDVIGIAIFLVSASGLYYKVFYEQSNKDKMQEVVQNTNMTNIRALNVRIDVLEARIKLIEDAETRREERDRILEEYRKLNKTK